MMAAKHEELPHSADRAALAKLRNLYRPDIMKAATAAKKLIPNNAPQPQPIQPLFFLFGMSIEKRSMQP